MISQENKQSGFTLIELMVVMAIIAILATAGLSAYTGYIKKVRDATRIADIKAINTVILGMMSSTGMPPQTMPEVYAAIVAANNGTALIDPLSSSNGSIRKYLCIGAGTSGTKECSYTFRVCDGGMGYAVGTRFESASNIPLYLTDNIPTCFHASWSDATIFELGSCQVSCSNNGTIPGCPTGWPNVLPTIIASSYTTPAPYIDYP